MSKPPAISDTGVAAIFKSSSPAGRKRLQALRNLIFDVASRTEGAGQIEESLKWGEPSYAPVKPKSGTAIRLHRDNELRRTKVCVHCQTSLIGDLREQYPDLFEYEGNRGFVLRDDEDIPVKELSHFIALALTYHQRKRI